MCACECMCAVPVCVHCVHVNFDCVLKTHQSRERWNRRSLRPGFQKIKHRERHVPMTTHRKYLKNANSCRQRQGDRRQFTESQGGRETGDGETGDKVGEREREKERENNLQLATSFILPLMCYYTPRPPHFLTQAGLGKPCCFSQWPSKNL